MSKLYSIFFNSFFSYGCNKKDDSDDDNDDNYDDEDDNDDNYDDEDDNYVMDIFFSYFIIFSYF